MKFNRFWLLIPALLPLALKSQYLLSAWKYSPMDRQDWIFLLAALVLAAIKQKTIRQWISTPDRRGLFAVASALLIYALFILKPVSTFQVGAGLLVFFSMLWVLGGTRLFSGCLPLFAICLLACPSTTYWSGFYLRILLKSDLIPGLTFKLLIGAALGGFFLWTNKPVRLRTVMYLCGILLLGLLLLTQNNKAQYGASLEPDLSRLKVGGYIAMPTEPSGLETRFFEGSALTKISYYGDQDQSVHLLSVKVTGNVHQLHPTELCLKSKKTVISGMREKTVAVESGKDLAVQELIAARTNGKTYLIYTWYVGPQWSTGNFIAFRKNWNRKDNWQSFQILTEINSTKTAAEERLNAFLKLLFAPTPDK